MPNLSEQDRQALRLADDLRAAMTRWLGQRGVDQACAVSPFVNPAGQPAVVMTMNALAVSALLQSIGAPRHPAGPPAADDPTGDLPFIP